jgi:rod shape-determining protein MreC
MRRNRNLALGLLLTLVIVIAFSFGGGSRHLTSGLNGVGTDAFAPVRSGVESITRPVGSFLAGGVHYGAARQQNQKLQSEIDQLKMQKVQAPYFKEDLNQLQALIDVKYISGYETVIAQVVGTDNDPVSASIDIGVGRQSGVQTGMPVIGAQGLVGQVMTVGTDSSTVRLLTDGQSKVGAEYGPGPNDLAVVQGQGPARPLVNFPIPVSRPISVGQIMTTPRLANSPLPPGIPVARVTSVSTGLTATQERLLLQPLADLSDLRYVAVVLY